MRILVFVVLLILGLAVAQTGGGVMDTISNAIGQAIDAITGDLLPKIATFLGAMVALAIGIAFVRQIRG